jgi:hypothetical protein
VLAMAGIVTVTMHAGHGSPTRGEAVAPVAAQSRLATRSPVAASSPVAIGDGADPKESGCAGQASSLAAATVADPNGIPYGIVELRYSPQCHAAWTRYTPGSGTPQPTTVTITVRRPDPIGNASVTFVVHDGAIYSDMELFRNGCIQAAAAVIDNNQVVADAHTQCVREPR